MQMSLKQLCVLQDSINSYCTTVITFSWDSQFRLRLWSFNWKSIELFTLY